MRIYISGPMRGYPDNNVEAFNQAEQNLVNLGHTVWSPAANEVWDTEHGPSKAMNLDSSLIKNWAEGIYVLDGWMSSFGSRAEVTDAEWAGIPIYNRIDWGATPVELVRVWPNWSGIYLSMYPSSKPVFDAAVNREIGRAEESMLAEVIGRAVSVKRARWTT